MPDPSLRSGAAESSAAPAAGGAKVPDEYFRLIAENASDVLWHNRTDGTMAWISPSATRVLGWRPAELVGRPMTDFIHPDDQTTALRARTRAAVGLTAVAEVRVQRSDGTWCPMEVRGGPYVDSEGQTDGTVAIGRDNSSIRSSHHRLQESERRFRLIAELADRMSQLAGVAAVATGAAELIAEEIGDACVISLLDDELLRPVAVAHHDRERQVMLRPLLDIDPAPWVQAVSSPALAVRRSLLITEPDVSLLGAGGRILGAYLDRHGTSGMVLVPLVVEGSPIGSLVVTRDGTADGFTAADQELLEEMGRRVALQVNDAALREALAQARAELRVIAESATDVVIRLAPDETADWVSPSVTEQLGYAAGDVLGTPVLDLVHPDDREALAEQLATTESRVVATVRLRTADGGYRWVAATCSRRAGTDDLGVTTVLGLRDIDAEVSAQEALVASERTFRTALQEAPSGMAIVGMDGHLLEVNRALCDIVGYDAADLVARTLDDITHPDDRDAAAEQVRQLVTGEIAASRTVKRLVRRDGRTIWVDVATSVVRTGGGDAARFVTQVADVDASRRAQDALEFQARHDPLTGLLNRSELLRALGERDTDLRRPGPFFAVLFCDLDHFKGVNDSLGHAAGDVVLRAAAARVGLRVRAGDVVARMGGDEFVVVLDAVHSVAEAQLLAEQTLETVAQPVTLPGPAGVVTPTVSIGVVVATSGAGVDRVLAAADHALYRAKSGGRARVVVHPDIMK